MPYAIFFILTASNCIYLALLFISQLLSMNLQLLSMSHPFHIAMCHNSTFGLTKVEVEIHICRGDCGQKKPTTVSPLFYIYFLCQSLQMRR